MWWAWLRQQVARHDVRRKDMGKVDVVCRTKDGREFSPFSIEWRGSTLVLCENEEHDDDEIVETKVVGHRSPRYPGEPKSRREIRQIVNPRPLRAR